MAANILDTIILFGDSITELAWNHDGTLGFALSLAVAYNRKLDVINRGLSEWVQHTMGINRFQTDICHKGTASPAAHCSITYYLVWCKRCYYSWGLPTYLTVKVDLSQYIENLHNIISLVQSPTSPYYSPKTRIILITPPPINPAQRPEDNERNNERTKAYAEAVKHIGEELQVPVLDIWTAFWDHADHTEAGLAPLLSDGLHLSAGGYKIVFDGLMKKIKENYPELSPDNLATVFPTWNNVVDPDNIVP